MYIKAHYKIGRPESKYIDPIKKSQRQQYDEWKEEGVEYFTCLECENKLSFTKANYFRHSTNGTGCKEILNNKKPTTKRIKNLSKEKVMDSLFGERKTSTTITTSAEPKKTNKTRSVPTTALSTYLFNEKIVKINEKTSSEEFKNETEVVICAKGFFKGDDWGEYVSLHRTIGNTSIRVRMTKDIYKSKIEGKLKPNMNLIVAIKAFNAVQAPIISNYIHGDKKYVISKDKQIDLMSDQEIENVRKLHD